MRWFEVAIEQRKNWADSISAYCVKFGKTRYAYWTCSKMNGMTREVVKRRISEALRDLNSQDNN